MKSILVDALYINQGGGKVLLDYLIQKLEDSDLDIHFLLDDRIKENHTLIKKNKLTYLKSNLQKRNRFYKNHKNDFDIVFCFASLPPLMKIKAKVFTYFHQSLYLEIPEKSGFKLTLLSVLKSRISKALKKNTDFWIVQSENVKCLLKDKYKLTEDKIKVIPFYPQYVSDVQVERFKNRYAYVSLPANYKNHERLIEAFVIFYKKTGWGELHLTVTENFPDLLEEINKLQMSGIPIVNHGFLKKKELIFLYQSSEYVCYPSLVESFGLGIIEALENGCKIIGANLPYMKAVCEPSIGFDPTSVSDMVKAFEQSKDKIVKQSKQMLFNEIDELIKIFSY